VVVGSGAEIQGGITVGNNVQVASGSIVLKDVPDNSVVVGVPGRVLYHEGKRVSEEVPDIEAQAIKALQDRILKLEHKVDVLSTAPASVRVEHLDDWKIKESGPCDGDSQQDAVDVFLHGAGI
jgi:serine O-acetyltransferase